MNILEKSARRPQGLHCSNSLVLVDRILPLSFLTSELVKPKYANEAENTHIPQSMVVGSKLGNEYIVAHGCVWEGGRGKASRSGPTLVPCSTFAVYLGKPQLLAWTLRPKDCHAQARSRQRVNDCQEVPGEFTGPRVCQNICVHS